MQRDPERRMTAREALSRLAAARTTVDGDTAQRPRRRGLFVGRARQLDRPHEALSAAKEGRATDVCIYGPSGIGKSALVQRFLDQVAGRNDVGCCGAGLR